MWGGHCPPPLKFANQPNQCPSTTECTTLSPQKIRRRTTAKKTKQNQKLEKESAEIDVTQNRKRVLQKSVPRSRRKCVRTT